MTSDSRRAGGGTLFTEPVLVVNQRPKLVETTNEFGVFDQHGRSLGAVVEVGQNLLRKALRLFRNYDHRLSHKFEVRDMGGSVVLKVTGPAKAVNSGFLVTRADGSPIGEISRENDHGKVLFTFTSGGARIGELRGETWHDWDFSIIDRDGSEVARVRKTHAGFLPEAFTTTDNYFVEMYRHLDDPLASIVVATALTVDTALSHADHRE